MPDHPTKWDHQLGCIVATSSKKSWIPFIISIFLALSVSTASIYDITTHLFVAKKPNYSFVTLSLHLCGLTVSGIVPITTHLLWKHRHCLNSWNQLVNFQKRLSTNDLVPEFKKTPFLKLFFIFDHCMLGFIVCVIVGPFVIIIVSLYINLDVFYFVICDIIGEFDKQPVHIKCLLYVIRITPLLCCFECSRTGGFMSVCFEVVLCKISVFAKILSTVKLSPNIKRSGFVLRSYFKFYVLFAQIKDMYLKTTSIVISSGFWLVVILSWMVVRAKELMPIEMYSMVVAMDIFAYLLATVSVYILSTLDETLKESLRVWQIEAKQNYLGMNLETKERRRMLLVLKKLADSLQPLGLMYKPFNKIDSQFFTDFSMNIIDRVFDCILIFDP